MNYRQAVLIDGKALSGDNTEIFDLRGIDPISELVIEYKGLNNGSTPTEHPAALITQIQVIDGSEVLVDLTGKEAIAAGYYHYHSSPLNGMNYVDNEYCWVTVRIPFGRWLWDPSYALDPAKFHNLQVIIKTDLNGGGSAPDAGILELIAHCFDGKRITPVGYLRTKEHYRYSVVASGEQSIQLPTDLVIKMLLLFGEYAGTALISQINKVKLTEDNDKKVPYNNNVSDMLKMLASDLPPYVENMRMRLTAAGVTHYITPFYEARLIGNADIAPAAYMMVEPPDGGTIKISGSAAPDAYGLVRGWAPHGCLGLELGDPWDDTDWYNPSGINDLRLKVTAGSGASSSGTNRLVLQQVKRY